MHLYIFSFPVLLLRYFFNKKQLIEISHLFSFTKKELTQFYTQFCLWEIYAVN